VPKLPRPELAAVAVGGAGGALLRVWLAERFAVGAASWPWAIFAINLSGCFALACLASALSHTPRTTYLRPLLGTGFCGAYTTFSTLALELLTMLDAGRYGLAVGYAAATLAGGLAAIRLGDALVHRIAVAR
jgi:CrcB protein